MVRCNIARTRIQEYPMSTNNDRFNAINEADIMRQAQSLRAETIGTFFARLFSKHEKHEAVFPAHVAPAE
jgi:hypothetical protein